MARRKKAAQKAGPEMRLVRPKVASSFPLHPGDVGIASVPVRVAKALIDSQQAMPVCGENREIQIAALCTAAEALDVTLTTKDPEIDEAAVHYGARCTLVGQKGAEDDGPPKE